MDTDGGGWTVFQRRQDGTVDFYRNWIDYKNGFPSNLNGEFWLGNDKLHRLTGQEAYSLRVDMEDVDGNTAYANYSSFSISAESDKYRLSIGGFSGNAGAWWYGSCHNANLNGLYHLGAHSSYADGVNWNHWKGYHYSLKRTTMKIRPTVQ
uniref:Fibrinogen C-terminal domain-containing protein n=1 Tax=Branchiostoma floridae TaxID=7739 RepID=C3Y4P8_BRAFL|eukprot:XP_002608695.1 hypothetical protein BRAFLDRAFT_58106 [Branchiostoma floridae]